MKSTLAIAALAILISTSASWAQTVPNTSATTQGQINAPSNEVGIGVSSGSTTSSGPNGTSANGGSTGTGTGGSTGGSATH